MKRNKTRLQALKGSIRKWKLIVDGKGDDNGTHNCPLCRRYFKVTCEGCPVAAASNCYDCNNTPYNLWAILHNAKGLKRPFKVFDVTTRNAAKAELAFLKSLLPKKVKA